MIPIMFQYMHIYIYIKQGHELRINMIRHQHFILSIADYNAVLVSGR